MEKLPIDNVHHTEGLRAEVFITLDQKWLIVRTFDNEGWLKSVTQVKYIDFGQGLRNRKDIQIPEERI
jgi:hypothetical protein